MAKVTGMPIKNPEVGDKMPENPGDSWWKLRRGWA